GSLVARGKGGGVDEDLPGRAREDADGDLPELRPFAPLRALLGTEEEAERHDRAAWSVEDRRIGRARARVGRREGPGGGRRGREGGGQEQESQVLHTPPGAL